MKTTIHCDERITNIRNTIYVKLFWGIIILDKLKRLGYFISALCVNHLDVNKRSSF